MKIGILTFHCAHNYGAVLQAYALQQKLLEHSRDVEIIDYAPDYLTAPYNVLNLRRFFSKNPIKLINNLLYAVISLRKRVKRSNQFNQFISNKLNVARIPSSSNTIPYDLCIIGSDQVWNPGISNGFDKIYFGHFNGIITSKIISYAASMGDAIINEQDKIFLRESLKNFDEISVRENRLIQLLQPLTEKIIINVLDPTLLLSASDWVKLAKKPSTNLKYVLVYQVRPDIHTVRVAREVAKQVKGVVIEISAGLSNNFADSKNLCITPEEFVGWMKYASYIVTTSFHGTAFAIIFNIPFITIGNSERGLARFNSLLEIFKLENKLITSSTNLTPEIINEEINWVQVNTILKKKQNESIDFLKKHI